jgi:hypothetical protein
MSRSANRRGLTPEEQARLFVRVEPMLRTLALYTMARWYCLGARRLSRMDLGEVTPDGSKVHDVLLQRPADPVVAAIVKRYLAKRCSCAHLRVALKTYRDAGGVERCHACHDDVRLQANPLFISRHRRRLSPKRMRHEFTQHRDALGLDPGLTFDSLRRAKGTAST